jgi:zona occludens toxin
MPINAFGGGPGSGKTYGVLEHVILPAVAKGRFVLTNIEGLEVEAIYQYVAEHFYKGKIICIGHIRACERNAPDDDDFFPGEAFLDKACAVPAPDVPKVVGGDLVVIDEATRYWPTDAKVKRSHAYFFREHRHFANECGHTCDLVVIDPDLTMLARAVKGKVELSSVTHKPKALGLNRYVVNLYRGVRVSRQPMSTNGPYKFRPEIYALYKSYSHANAKEQVIDKRQNLLFSPRVVVIGVCFLLLGAGGVYGIRWFFGGGRAHAMEAHKAAPVASNQLTGGAAAPAPLKKALPSFSDVWRIVGVVGLEGQRYVVLSDAAGRLRYESPSLFTLSGPLLIGDVDGARVTYYSGAAPSASLLSPGGKKP